MPMAFNKEMLSSLNLPDFCTAIRNLLLSIMFILILLKNLLLNLQLIISSIGSSSTGPR
jgi:hypothetical protein